MLLEKSAEKYCPMGLAVIETEAKTITALRSRINADFSKACNYLYHCKGRIVVIGMGKSGHIANKIAATFASTGSPAFFVHPGEANHGDMGMITGDDVILAISNSGETEEILSILPVIKCLGLPLITLTGKKQSTLSQAATVNIDISVEKEACPLGLAPTSSTTAALVMGDALAIALLETRGFTPEDFARSHPGGSLGRRLLLCVDSLMRKDEGIPHTKPTTKLTESLMEMTQKGLGMTAIVDDENKILGIYTDGDLRRTLDKELDFHQTCISEVMTRNCKTILPTTLAMDALEIMEKHKITSLLVATEDKTLLGVVHLHDILRAGVV